MKFYSGAEKQNALDLSISRLAEAEVVSEQRVVDYVRSLGQSEVTDWPRVVNELYGILNTDGVKLGRDVTWALLPLLIAIHDIS